MRREVKGIEEALAVLRTRKISWVTVNRIQNSLWETGIAFFNEAHYRVAYYDEVHSRLAVHQG